MRLLQTARQKRGAAGRYSRRKSIQLQNETQLGRRAVQHALRYRRSGCAASPPRKPVVMTASAGQDTSSVDQLHLTFTVGGNPVDYR